MVGIEFSHARVTVARGDVWGRIVDEDAWRTIRRRVDTEPHASIDEAARLARALAGDRDLACLVGIGIAVAAPVDPESELVRALQGEGGEAEPQQLTWVGLSPERQLSKRLYDWPAEYILDNDVNFAARDEYQWLSEQWRGTLNDFVHLKWSSGIGSALILNGDLHRGTGGFAGEIGHTRVWGYDGPAPTTDCQRCGKTMCLENLFSYRAMKQSLRLEHLSRLEFEKYPRGRELLSQGAVYVGRALGQLVNAVNPQAIAISGPSPQLHSMIIQQVQLGLRETSIAAASDVEIYVAEPRWRAVGDDIRRLAVVRGAMHAVVVERSGAHLLERLQRSAQDRADHRNLAAVD
jgi:predicted NBD/HSP70 family sugar kinase